MNECNPTGAEFAVEYMLSKLDEAEAWAKNKYDEDLEEAIVKIIGTTVRRAGWRELFRRFDHVATREDATFMVKHEQNGWTWPLETDLRISRNNFLRGVEELRTAATTAQGADIQMMFVSKADMVYLS